MNFDKDTILQFLRGSGQHTEANQAARELPNRVDTDQHAGLLEKFGVNPAELIAKFTGGSGTGGSATGLGGILDKIL